MKHKRENHRHAQNKGKQFTWAEIVSAINEKFAFYETNKKEHSFIGKIVSTTETKTQKCITVLVISTKTKALKKNTETTLCYIGSKLMWELVKKNQPTNKIYQLKKAA